jgi:hypothetical protein
VHLRSLLLEVLRPGAVVARFKSAQDELEVLQTWFVDRGISMPWPTAPTLNVPNISRNQWDGASADRVATALAARYPERAVNRR